MNARRGTGEKKSSVFRRGFQRAQKRRFKTDDEDRIKIVTPESKKISRGPGRRTGVQAISKEDLLSGKSGGAGEPSYSNERIKAFRLRERKTAVPHCSRQCLLRR